MSFGGRFEIWSLSKILGTVGGGVIWCRDESDAQAVKESVYRSRTHPHLRWLLRATTLGGRAAMLDAWWSAGETASDGTPSRLLAAEASSRLRQWPELVSMRSQRAEQVMDGKVELVEEPDSTERLPCLLPAIVKDQQVKDLEALGLPSSRRHFLDQGMRLVLAYPLPIHQGVSDEQFASAMRILVK